MDAVRISRVRSSTSLSEGSERGGSGGGGSSTGKNCVIGFSSKTTSVSKTSLRGQDGDAYFSCQ